MALPMLMNGGADCGPSNALQGFSKQFDQDRGAAHDRLDTRPGQSSSTFRTRPVGAAANPLEQDAMRFFGGPSTSSVAPVSFDVTALRGALPVVGVPQVGPAHGWAADFARASGRASAGGEWALQMQAQGMQSVERGAMSPPAQMQGVQHSMAYTPMSMNMPAFNHVWPAPMQPTQQPSEPQIVFPDIQPQTTVEPTHVEPTHSTSSTGERSELAETARQLLDALQHETRPKFQNSQFMGLMRQLRDGQVVVQDGEMVPASEARLAEPALDKGKGKAVDGGGIWSTEYSTPLLQRRKSVHFEPGSEEAQQTEQDDAFDNADVFYDIYNRERQAASVADPQKDEWAHLQDQWESFEATASGIKPVQPRTYGFQKNNPYLAETRTHAMHRHGAGLQQSVLEHEAIVQRDPTNAQAWFALGVKQQENEREQHAIDALREAVLQDPSCMPAYLALAVSYANEGDRVSVHRAIGDWMTGRGAKVRKVGGLGELGVMEGVASVEEIHQEYVSGLLNMARQSSSGEIDADIQIALGVLLNTMEDYSKAQDCFRTALAVRPDDWLLFNRVGATLANSGNLEEAVPFYYKALELNPGYIRARYNLGISCINLRRYEEAAQHLVDALVLQESEGANSERGVTSDSLWDTLRSTCLNLQRVDLAVVCETRDLQKFINRFHQTEA
ncbi:peroxisomal targeting signal 1 receptor [Rhizoctonia solani AG-3 Rhs1AP]|uniref:Peroxisomal targeting signal 1 receptor n=1 Tax=Rhizoctonia solani AG-3 Rhs1AP TaxID=1086054 RepID=X8JKK1_9AGAM|nr:peroxisomal targeting signal 1 receptor [Rhizoctonia solani AG-3 Rhs1AP]